MLSPNFSLQLKTEGWGQKSARRSSVERCHFRATGPGGTKLIVARLWHKDVFLGARDSGTGNPGAKNRDFHYSSTGNVYTNQAKILTTQLSTSCAGSFLATKLWEETEKETEVVTERDNSEQK